jgi:hypothetical protein
MPTLAQLKKFKKGALSINLDAQEKATIYTTTSTFTQHDDGTLTHSLDYTVTETEPEPELPDGYVAPGESSDQAETMGATESKPELPDGYVAHGESHDPVGTMGSTESTPAAEAPIGGGGTESPAAIIVDLIREILKPLKKAQSKLAPQDI